MAERVPPGRAGRLWLMGRLDYARRSLELLDRKHLLLLQELEGLTQARAEARQRWTQACTVAERWGLRAVALGGASDIAVAAAAVAEQARVHVPWRNTMGVVHPGEPGCTLPALPPSEAAAGNAAIAPAAVAQRDALLAAAAFGALDRSHHLLTVELRATQRRRRAIERTRIPSLEAALERLELRLDELEREERVVNRWARQRYGPVVGGSRITPEAAT